jgi:Trk K+ transport system NAD-binding subunit
MRVGIIRAGAVGSALALALVMRGAAREVVLVDRTRERCLGPSRPIFSTVLRVAIGRYQGRRFQ